MKKKKFKKTFIVAGKRSSKHVRRIQRMNKVWRKTSFLLANIQTACRPQHAKKYINNHNNNNLEYFLKDFFAAVVTNEIRSTCPSTS
jgi:hypothetical protein